MLCIIVVEQLYGYLAFMLHERRGLRRAARKWD